MKNLPRKATDITEPRRALNTERRASREDTIMGKAKVERTKRNISVGTDGQIAHGESPLTAG